MRMIDADALKKELSGFNYDMALRIVDTQPTIDAEPVRHGRWNDKPDEYSGTCIIRHCSECGWSVFKGNPLYDFGHWNYCPNCGAEMYGGADNGT